MQEPIQLPFRTGNSPRLRMYWVVLFIVLGAILLSARTAIACYVNALWYESLGYGDVFLKTLALKWVVFAIFAAATFLVLCGWLLALIKATEVVLLRAGTLVVGTRTIRLPVTGALRFGAAALSLLIALVTGASMMADWPQFALFWYGRTAAGSADPILGKSLQFYLFTLPVWQSVAGWLLMLAIFVCMATVFFVLISGGSRFSERAFAAPLVLPWRPLSFAAAALLLVLALRVYLGRIELLLDDHTVFSGVTYTDAHILLGGMLAVCIALVVGALIACINLGPRPALRWLVLAPVPAVACYLLMQIAAWYVSSFIVKPNQLVREEPYITHNIDFTRAAFGLDRVAQQKFPAETDPAAVDVQNNQATIENIRLWDWHALQDTLRQIQEIRTYYDFPDVDIDRYNIEGRTREVMLAARELSLEKLPESSRNWINEKLIYTHGYGITMNPVNGFTTEGLPTLLLSNMPIQSAVPGLTVKRPEIYFGQLTNTDVYVKTRQKEFNYPEGETNSLTSYQGDGGIELGSFPRRIMIAFDRGDLTKLPFSDDIDAQSRLLMRRNVVERAQELAPYLTYDADPYIVIGDDGRLLWMLDAFTTSDTYPYASHYAFRGEPVNYARNSVKVVVDAYSGATTFYVFDGSDPIISAYRAIFPSLFKDAAAMPADLRRHVRYPEPFLKLQAQVLGLYHMTDPVVFYNREDLWTIASEVGTDPAGEQSTQPMNPNFVLMTLPGESQAEFINILPFTPSNRNNLIGWIAGRSDGAHYGTSIVYDFPKTKLVDGPMQVEARIDQNAQLSGQLTLWNQQGSHVRRGTLLVIPCGKALMYAEPIYLQADRSPMPELRLVVLAVQDKLAYGSTFETAMRALFGGGASSVSAETAAPQASAPAGSKATPAEKLDSLIQDAASDLAQYQQLTAQGKLTEAGAKLEDLKRKLDALNGHGK